MTQRQDNLTGGAASRPPAKGRMALCTPVIFAAQCGGEDGWPGLRRLGGANRRESRGAMSPLWPEREAI